MDADVDAAARALLDGPIAGLIVCVDGLTKAATSQAERIDELENRIAGLAGRIATHREGTALSVAALTEQLDSLEERLTTVHRAALRALNLTTGGAPAA